MNLLEMFFDVTVTSELPTCANYDFWCVTEDDKFVLLRTKENISNVTNVKLNKQDIVDYLFNSACDVGDCYLISEEELKVYGDIEIEFECIVDNMSNQKYPLVCVRGECDSVDCHKCSGFYCFHDTPCFKCRPDWNCWSAKYPEFLDLLLDVVKWINRCNVTDALVVMFQYTPTYWEPELSYDYAIAIQVRNKKLRIVNDVRKLYEEYNRKYPTEDREIEKSINGSYFNNSNVIFKF